MTASPAPSTALDLHKQIQSGQLSAQALLEQTFNAIKAVDGDIDGFLHLAENQAQQTAEQVDQAVATGQPLPLLAGVPIALKDNIHVQGVRSTCASRILENFVAPFDATVTTKLNAHMLPIVGKTTLDEVAMGSSCENSAYKLSKNPWDTSRVPGGSSGGSAAVVASNQVPLALGSDTGGSVRLPAAFCALYGIKPTYGRVSRYGLVAYGSSLDQISPFARTTKDLAALLKVIAGFDPMDSTALSDEVPDYLALCDQPPKQLKVGLVKELMDSDGLQPDIKAAIDQSIQHLEGLGATFQTVSLPHINYAVASYYIVATAEASSNLARYDGVRYGLRAEEAQDIYHLFTQTREQGFGTEVKRRIMLGTFALSSGYYDAYYGKAQKVRQLIRQDFETAFEQVDILLCPAAPFTAFKLGEKVADPVQMYLTDIATIPVNLAGIPGLSFPAGFDSSGLPIGLQLLGPHGAEGTLFSVSQALETASGLSNCLPDVYKQQGVAV
ncbi:MAG: Asp-tRNA(Asn)/Glu-tRNA(Gln) amidotransferase subunit GatA [Vampirovibrionales bacterium]